MANTQIEMRKVKRIYKLYSSGVSKRQISKQLGLSRNTITKYIDFFKRYRLTSYEVSEMTLEELHKLFKSNRKPKSQQLLTLEKYFPYFDKELRKTGVTKQLLWQEYYDKHPDGFRLSQFRYSAVMENIDYERSRNLDKNQVQRFASCDFIKKKENILITGSTGVGKSYLASAMGHQACSQGFRVMYFNANKLFTMLTLFRRG